MDVQAMVICTVMSSSSKLCLEPSQLSQYDDLKEWNMSESTFPDVDMDGQFGHPFERMDPVGRSSTLFLLGSECRTVSDSWDRQSSSTESAVSATDCVTYEDLAESIHRMQICPYMTQENYIPISHSTPDFKYELMVRIVSRSSEELRLLNHMNHPSHRADPWNPAPYLLCTIDRDETDVYACFEDLAPYDQPPLSTVAHYLDFFRQVLEGLTFLHELSIVNLNCAKSSSFMIDLSAGSSTSSAEIPSSLISPASQRPPHIVNSHNVPSHDPSSGPTQDASSTLPADQDLSSIIPNNNKGLLFDRTKFPVKYYIVDYSDAVQLSYHRDVRDQRTQNQHPTTTTTDIPSSYINDVRDLGTLFSNVLDNVPELDSNFRTLVSAMITGELTADDTRKLFAALCHTLEASVFDVSVPLPRPTPDTFTRSNESFSSDG